MQRFIHWLEEGRGDTLLRILTAVLFVVLCSFYLSGKRYKGPANERVLERAVMAQSLADGAGFITRVWHPQAVAMMEQRTGSHYSAEKFLPDLYNAPGYPVVIAGVLKAMPEKMRAWLESEPHRTYYLADFFLLGVSLFFFWVNMALIAVITKHLFSARAAWLASTGYLLSAGIWEGIFAVDGGLMLSFLALLLLGSVLRFEVSRSGWSRWLWPALAGLFCGGLFLTDYPAGLTLVPTVAYLGLRAWMQSERKRRWPEALFAVALAVVCFMAVVSPWLWRNIELTGHPLALAGQEIAWKAGDPTAEPENFRNQLSSATASVNFRKLLNKGLDGMAAGLRGNLWQGGGLLFVGFFLASLFYQFRRGSTNALRWYALGLIAVQAIGAPFLNSGEAPLLAGVWLAPLFIIFGAGFFFVLMESAGVQSPWKKRIWITAVVALQALPITHWLLQPAVLGNYSFPPYAPSVFRAIKVGIADQFYSSYGLMSDVPAGLAWYGQVTVWGQPNQMGDFVSVLERQPIGALLLSPHRLDQPFYTHLLLADKANAGKDVTTAYGWGALYHGLASGRVPAFFPLQKPMKIWDNIYVCLDPLAYRPGTIR